MYGVGARNSPISVQLPDRPQRTFLIPEAELERETKKQRQAESDTRGERGQRQVPIETPPVTLTPAQHFDFSASPFHRWNSEAQREKKKKRKTPYLMAQTKGVSRKGCQAPGFPNSTRRHSR